MTDPIRLKLLQELEKYPSQRALALEFGIPPQTLSDILSGRAAIGRRTLERILWARPGWARSLDPNHQED